MGDEGIGLEVVRHLQNMPLPEGVECLDGGIGSFNLLEPMQRTESKHYPRSLTVLDMDLKDLMEAFYCMEKFFKIWRRL